MTEKYLIQINKIIVNSRTEKASGYIIDLINHYQKRGFTQKRWFPFLEFVTDKEIKSLLSSQGYGAKIRIKDYIN